MFKMIVASHGKLSIGIKNMLDLIVGDNGREFDTFCLNPGDDAEKYMQDIAADARENPKKTLIVITDIFGGSVNNSALINLQEENIFIVTGIIPAFILELFLMTESPSFEELEDLLVKSKQSIKIVKKGELNIEEEVF